MKNEPKVLTPKLRFPQFRDGGQWSRRPLSDLCDRILDKVGDIKLTPVSISAGRGFVSQTEKFGRDISGAQYKNYIRLRRGEFAYNKGNSILYPQGCVYQLKEFDEAAASNAFICFRLKSDNAPAFFEGLFEKNSHGSQLLRFLTSGARADGLLNIRADDFFSISLPIPPQPAEQRKIAACLTSLGELLGAEERKLEALRAHKKGLMQQLFPLEGETVPRLRFPEFSDAGEWSLSPLGTIADLKNGYAFKSSTYAAGDFRIVTIANVQSGKLTLDETKSIATLPIDLQAHQRLQVGDILISMTGNVGRVCLVDSSKLLLNQRVGKLLPRNVEPGFFYQTLQREEFRIGMGLKAAGGAQGNLSNSDITGFVIAKPREKEEQECIAACLSSLDILIAAQTRKLDGFRVHKKGLMQRLFPSPEGN